MLECLNTERANVSQTIMRLWRALYCYLGERAYSTQRVNIYLLYLLSMINFVNNFFFNIYII